MEQLIGFRNIFHKRTPALLYTQIPHIYKHFYGLTHRRSSYPEKPHQLRFGRQFIPQSQFPFTYLFFYQLCDFFRK